MLVNCDRSQGKHSSDYFLQPLIAQNQKIHKITFNLIHLQNFDLLIFKICSEFWELSNITETKSEAVF